MVAFYYCECYLTHNIYIKGFNMHFIFHNLKQFCRDYSLILPALGCDTETKKSALLQKVIQEVDRRNRLQKEMLERKKLLHILYKPIDTSVYELQDNFLDPHFKFLVKMSMEFKKQNVLPYLDVISEEKQLYGLPVFTQEFCAIFLRELNNYSQSDLPKGRPNSMNRYGVLLDEIGFHDNFSQVLRTKYLDPLSALLFPEWRGEGLDSHKIFSVGYKIGEDEDLSYHYDNSEITLNVCLGTSFEGGELYFGDFRTKPISQSSCILQPHKVGYGIFHRGQQLHGALPITKGERQNLVFWMRASSVRNKMCPMCKSKPNKLIASEGYGDGFTMQVEPAVEVCSVT